MNDMNDPRAPFNQDQPTCTKCGAETDGYFCPECLWDEEREDFNPIEAILEIGANATVQRKYGDEVMPVSAMIEEVNTILEKK